MDTIEFGKLCRPYNIEYRKLFGYVPCRGDYAACDQNDYLAALKTAVDKRVELHTLIRKRDPASYNPKLRY